MNYGDTHTEFLGDGLFVTHDGYQVELYAHNGLGKTNQVFLEPRVLVHFIRWLQESQFKDALK